MDERRQLAHLQRQMFEALAEGRLDGSQVRDHSPALVSDALGPQHRANLLRKIDFYLPRFSASQHLWGDLELPTANPTTWGHSELLDHLVGWLLPQVATWTLHQVWTELIQLDRAWFLAKSRGVDTQAELVAAARALTEKPDHGPLCVVHLQTNLVDLLDNQAWAVTDARPFGPPRQVAVFRTPPKGPVRHLLFSSPSDLAVRLCFS